MNPPVGFLTIKYSFSRSVSEIALSRPEENLMKVRILSFSILVDFLESSRHSWDETQGGKSEKLDSAFFIEQSPKKECILFSNFLSFGIG